MLFRLQRPLPSQHSQMHTLEAETEEKGAGEEGNIISTTAPISTSIVRRYGRDEEDIAGGGRETRERAEDRRSRESV